MAPPRAARKVRGQKRERDPDQPKKPAGGAYGIFLAENRQEIVKSLPTGSSVTLVAKEASRLWKEKTDEDKAPFQKKYEAAMETYTKAMEEYKQNKPDVQSTPTKKSRTEAVEPPSAAKATSSAKATRAKDAAAGPEALVKQVRSRRELHARAQRHGWLHQMLALSQEPEVLEKGLSEKHVFKALSDSAGLIDLARSKLLSK